MNYILESYLHLGSRSVDLMIQCVSVGEEGVTVLVSLTEGKGAPKGGATSLSES